MESSLAGIIQRLIELLKLQSTLPALLWLVVNYLVFGEYLENYRLLSWWAGLQTGEQVAFLFLISVLLGYTLDSLNFVLLGSCVSSWRRVRFAWLEHRSIFELGEKQARGMEKIARRYGIQKAVVWPHFNAILSKNGYAAQIEREKAGLDFFLNLSLLSLLLVVESIVTHALGWSGSFMVPWLSFGAMLFFYRLAIPSAEKWYDWINAAFDLYRYDLAEQLNLIPFKDKCEEEHIWRSISLSLQSRGEFMNYHYPLPRKRKGKKN